MSSKFVADTRIDSSRPDNVTGALYLVGCSSVTALAIVLSLHGRWLVWMIGQIVLAFAFVQWFAILHEAGHKTLFRSRRMNRFAAHLSGLMALIPGDCWRLVHAKHHYWTGWQDLDMTTQSLVPRRLSASERWVVNICWALWIPLFATLYRMNNYWNLPRLWRLFGRSHERMAIVLNISMYTGVYLLLLWLIPGPTLFQCLGLALWLSFGMQDLIILSQHTHIPLKLAQGRPVKPIEPSLQDGYTRSLEFPLWVSRFWLLNMDAHSLHHMYPSVPGYHLHRLDQSVTNRTLWWRWVLRAKSVRGDVLLFQNRDQTGFYF